MSSRAPCSQLTCCGAIATVKLTSPSLRLSVRTLSVVQCRAQDLSTNSKATNRFVLLLHLLTHLSTALSSSFSYSLDHELDTIR